VAARGHAPPRELATEVCGATDLGEPSQLAPQGLDLRRSVESEQPTELLGAALLETVPPQNVAK
jgi:hypothetical protein